MIVVLGATRLAKHVSSVLLEDRTVNGSSASDRVVTEADGQERKTVVSAPTGFRWIETGQGMVPVYGRTK